MQNPAMPCDFPHKAANITEWMNKPNPETGITH